MKYTLSACALGLALTLAAAGCDRNKSATPAQAPAAAPADATPIALQKVDTVQGSGATATAGKTVTVHYTGWLCSPNAQLQHGAQFDSSVGGQPFTFQLGSGQVIKGWDQGVEGMKVGGKRTIIVPADLGYGAQGAGPIPPNANLIFDVELLDVK